jgi:NAD(P)-dependent dehydrogenase (short-subunit alcohol dehydrogenase family)
MNAKPRGATPFDFSGATAVIVGGASGLGRAMAAGLADHGASVCIVARTREKAETSAALIAANGASCFPGVADVASESSIEALGDAVDRRFSGGVNVVVNCAGINIRNPIERISLEEWESIQRVNSTGAFLLARTMYPRLKRAGWGRLIHVTSIFASRSFPHRTSYASSKGALLQLTRTLAVEWARQNITVNAISPGPIVTDMTRPILDNPDAYSEFCRNIPIGRFGEPDEVVTACLFLASPNSSFVTGAEIAVDGGWMAS